MKKILIVTRSTVYHNKSGGMETQLANLINSLSSKYEITVLTTAKSSVNQKINITEIINGVTYIFLKNTIPGEYGFNLYENIFWQLPVKRNFSQFDKNFRNKAADFYHKYLSEEFHTILSQSSAANSFKINKNNKLVLIYHGTTLNELKSRLKGLRSLKDLIRISFLDTPSLIYEYLINNTFLFIKASKIILVSSLILKDFRSQYPFFSSKAEVIDNAIDTEKFNISPKLKNFNVIYFGRIDFEKGLDLLASTAKKLPEVVFNVYGKGTDAVEFLKLIKKEKIDNLKFFGEVDNARLSKILSKMHCFLFLTKRKEGFPMSILESLACGVAIVTTLDLDLINKNAPFIKVSSDEDAVTAINGLNKNRAELIKISKASRKFILENYSLEKLANEYEKILK